MYLEEIDENAVINRISKGIPRAKEVVNKIHQSDAEILEVGLPDRYLAVTMDVISEEIEVGMFTQPEFMGWMMVVVNLSDLAAVGAVPFGLLLTMTLSPSWNDAFVSAIRKGIASACQHYRCGIVGGELNTGSPSLGGTALGFVKKTELMQRRGMRNGDIIYTTGPAGLGNAYYVGKAILKMTDEELQFKPHARVQEAPLITEYATACMDTSDGLFGTLDQLMRLNEAALIINNLDSVVHPKAKKIGESMRFHPYSFLAGIHGDFELVFTIPSDRETEFLEKLKTKTNVLTPIRLGHVEKDKNMKAGVYFNDIFLPTGKMRNLWRRSPSINDYIQSIVAVIDGLL